MIGGQIKDGEVREWRADEVWVNWWEDEGRGGQTMNKEQGIYGRAGGRLERERGVG